METQKQFNIFKKDLLENIEKQLLIEFVLAITGEKTGSKKELKKTNNSVLIDRLTRDCRNDLIKIVDTFYKDLEIKLESVFQHKGTKIIELEHSIILKGMERALLKRAPSEKATVKNENQHLRDVDCIAFESVLSFINNKTMKISDQDFLYIIVKDSDYTAETGDRLKDELVKDLAKFRKDKILYGESIDYIFSKKAKQQKSKSRTIAGSLSSESIGLADSSK